MHKEFCCFVYIKKMFTKLQNINCHKHANLLIHLSHDFVYSCNRPKRIVLFVMRLRIEYSFNLKEQGTYLNPCPACQDKRRLLRLDWPKRLLSSNSVSHKERRTSSVCWCGGRKVNVPLEHTESSETWCVCLCFATWRNT